MEIRLVRAEFQLPGCHSLKEKRQRIAGLKKRIGQQGHMAIRESDFHDQHQRVEWSIIILADHNADADKSLNALQEVILESLDGRLVAFDQEPL